MMDSMDYAFFFVLIIYNSTCSLILRRFLLFCFLYLWILLTFSFIITVEDVSDLWPTVKGLFEEHQPLKRAVLTNKTRNPVLVENLPVEFILTTDARLRSRFPHEQYLYWFREPYATIVLVTCEVCMSHSLARLQKPKENMKQR